MHVAMIFSVLPGFSLTRETNLMAEAYDDLRFIRNK